MPFTERTIATVIVALCCLVMGTYANMPRAQSACEATEVDKLLPFDGAAGDQFGAVAIDGDTAVIGARLDDDNGTNSGSTYVFRFDGSSWVQEAKLLASDGAADDSFGQGVAIEGSVAVIGAMNHVVNGTDSGAAYVFRFDGSNWLQEAKLVPSDGVPNGYFGWSVAMADGRVLIGAPYDVGGGSAYVFRHDGLSWVEEAKLQASDGAEGDLFGELVAMDGGVAVIGATSSEGYRWGAAYVFRFDGSNWVEEQKLLPSDSRPNDFFGQSPAVSGDTIVVGAYEYFDGPGSVYVFRHDGTSWVEEAKLLASDGMLYDAFGRATAVVDDMVVIGAEQTSRPGPGAAYVFRHDGLAWVEQAKIVASDGVVPDRFGRVVAISGDTAMIGVQYRDVNGTDSGAVYVFRGLSDCNDNGTLDICDITEGTSADDNSTGIPDECEDADSDGIMNEEDNCPMVYNAGQGDGDSDGEGDVCDDCTDTDSDGSGNPGFPDNTCALDNCPNDVNAGQQDVDSDGLGDVCDACPNDPNNDGDGDGVCGDADNCPPTANPGQSDVDSDGAGDLCDVCPADPADECDPNGSTAEEIAADEGGTVETPDGELTIDIDSDDLAQDTTVSVTETIPQDPEVDLMVGPNPGLGQAISVYDLQPDGQVFDAPVTLTIITDVSDLNPNFFDDLTLYRWTDTDSDGTEDTFVEIYGAACSVVNEPAGCDPKNDPPTVCVSTATCTAEVDHFSVHAQVAPLDSDDDGIPDRFGGIEDICPNDSNIIEGFLPPMMQLAPAGEAVILPDNAFKGNRTLPMKFDYLCGTIPVTDQDAVTPPELLEVYRIGDAEPLPIVDPDSGESNDSGVWFRYSDEHWIYNFSTSGLPVGTYEVHVRMPDGRIFKGGFVLR